MGYSIAPQFISHDLPGLATVVPHQPLEEALGCSPISLRPKVDINDLSILVYGSPQIMLLAIDLHEDFIDVECVAKASVLSLKPSSVHSSKLDAPEPDGFVTYDDPSLG
jgi:hypothetical protein